MPITGDEVTARAQANAHGLMTQPLWTPGFLGATPDPNPWRVQLTDVEAAETPLYFIVTFRRGKQATARMAIHADTGAIREIRAIQKTGSQLIEFVDPLTVPWPVGAPAAPTVVEPDLFWRPGRASISMLDPFFVVARGGRKLFIRVDGRMFADVGVIGHG